MKIENRVHNRAFKEWAISCEAMRTGEQILLVRKGGIREEGGTFTVADTEFFLMPTYEHQNAELLQPEWASRLAGLKIRSYSDAVSTGVSSWNEEGHVTLNSYAVVDTILQARDDAQVNAVAAYHIWNPTYVKQRFDFNPYDPLYLMVLRVYNLPEPVVLPMRRDYIGCKSWVTLESSLSLEGVSPALSDEAYSTRRAELLALLR